MSTRQAIVNKVASQFALDYMHPMVVNTNSTVPHKVSGFTPLTTNQPGGYNVTCRCGVGGTVTNLEWANFIGKAEEYVSRAPITALEFAGVERDKAEWEVFNCPDLRPPASDRMQRLDSEGNWQPVALTDDRPKPTRAGKRKRFKQ